MARCERRRKVAAEVTRRSEGVHLEAVTAPERGVGARQSPGAANYDWLVSSVPRNLQALLRPSALGRWGGNRHEVAAEVTRRSEGVTASIIAFDATPG